MKIENCVLGLDPLECFYRESCRYWNGVSQICEYRAIKDEEHRRRRDKKFQEQDVMSNAVRINKP